MTLALLLLLSASGLDGGAAAEPAGDATAAHLKGAVEAGGLLLPSSSPGTLDGYLALHPMARLEVSSGFALQLGALVRVRLDGVGGLVRRADWDELSDLGQLLEALSLGGDSAPVRLRAGPVRTWTLGQGHLITRYSNQENADYHPAAAWLVAGAGPARVELFASDVLGARVFAGELGWDLGRTFSADPAVQDRYLLAVEVAHDAARAGLPFRSDPGQPKLSLRPVTLVHLDASATLARGPTLQLVALVGGGARLDTRVDFGVLAGATLDLRLAAVGLSLRLEGRRQQGGFRQGFFGPTAELSRFADQGFSGVPQAERVLPPGYSLATEARLGWGTQLTLEVAAEHFFSGRTDLDSTATLELLGARLLADARYGVVGLGEVPRHALSVGLRLRLAPSVYVLAGGGTAFFPQPDGTLLRGVTASLGLGLDFER
jgi:hypothetical protein